MNYKPMIRKLACLSLLFFLSTGTTIDAKPTKADPLQPVELSFSSKEKSQYSKLVLEAQDCLNGGRLKQALSICSSAAQLEPERAEAYLLEGVALRRARRPKLSLRSLNKSIELKPLPQAYLERGATLLGLSHEKAAIKDFSRAIELMPKNDRAYFRRAVAYDQMVEFNKALADLNKAIQLNPKSMESYFMRGHVYMGLNEPLKAIAEFDRVIAVNDNPKAHFNKASSLVHSDQPEKAIQEYTLSLKLDPDNHNALLHRGRTYVLIGKPDLAIQDFTRALSYKPENTTLLYMLRGRAYQLAGNMKKARDDLQQATMDDAGLAVMHYSGGIEEMLLKHPYKAKQAFQSNPTMGLEVDQAFEEALKLEAKKNYQGALAALNKILANYPDMVMVYVERGKVLMKLKKYDDALRSFSLAWRKNNINMDAVQGRALAYEAKGDPQHALPDINKMIWWDSFCPNYYFQKARVMEKLGRGPKAAEYYKKFLDLAEANRSKVNLPVTKYSISDDNVRTAKEKMANYKDWFPN